MNYNFLQNKKILVTGGTGSLGRELVRKILQYDPKVIRILDVDETEQFEFQHELKEYEDKVRFLLGDVRDRDRLYRAASGVDIIVHAAGFETCAGV